MGVTILEVEGDNPETGISLTNENSDITLYPFYLNFVEVEGRMISILHIKKGQLLVW